MAGILISKKQSTSKSNLLEKKSEEGTKPTRYYSNKQEKKIAEDLGGRQTSNSGATPFGGKSDVSISNLISIEAKTKTKHSDSISIKKEWFEKLRREALFDGHPYTALALSFGPDEENFYIIDEVLFEELIDYLKSKHD